MPIASGVNAQVRAKKETAWGVLAGATGASQIRRRSCDLDISKDAYESSELVTHYQVGDFRHGLQRAQGNLVADVSPGAHGLFIQSALRRDFAAVSAITGLSITIAGSGPTYTVTRSAGDWLAGGIKRGMVGRLTAGTFNSNNSQKNLLVLSATATVLTVLPGGNGTMTAEGPIASATFTPTGKSTYIPASGHSNDSYTVERWFADIAQSRVYTGCRIASLAINLPASGLNEINVGFLGKGLGNRSTSAYFTSPAAAPTFGSLAAVNGAVAANGAQIANLTGLQFSLENGMSVGPVVGSNFSPDVFTGRARITGQFTAYLENATFLDAFADETIVDLAGAFYTGSEANADFMAFALPRLKLGSASIDDGEKGLIVTCSFQALFNSAGGAGQQTEQTTLWLQDSQAP